jgi:alkylation response protein AidB-like acyl-CoA dehydrogenase
MKREYLSMELLRYLLYDVHRIDRLTEYPRFSHVGGREEIDLLLQSARDIADREMFPFFKEMDMHPVEHRDGHVRTHPQLKRIFRAVADAGWFTATTELEHGGTQLPYSVFSSAQLIFEAANNSAQGYLGVSTGALDLIASFGNEALRATYMPPMMDGRWQGTMALTEPQAGSSLSDIRTSATPMPDGSFHITGQKIFISAGEHEACENFIHLTLARIEGAPAGTKGISLFVVPKFLPDGDGTPVYNHVQCVADFQKMGQRGYATTHLIFGEQGPTKAFLVGEPHKGLSYMFQMMNAARIVVGQTAAAVASAAYHYALQYATERPQGRPIGGKDPLQEPVPIIRHADVRRMLLQQKCFVEGALSLVVECLKWFDMEKVLDGDEKRKAWLLLELLTPIVKTWPSEEGLRSVSNALQVFGGYGFTMDFDAQQYYRDIRIMSIYEGTTGIQSIDLLGRKLTMDGGRAAQLLGAEISAEISLASADTLLASYAAATARAVQTWQKVLVHLQGLAGGGDTERYLADANLFMELSGLVTIAWQWLKMGNHSQAALREADLSESSAAFHRGRLASLRFFFKYELPRTSALAESLMHADAPTLHTEVDTFR